MSFRWKGEESYRPNRSQTEDKWDWSMDRKWNTAQAQPWRGFGGHPTRNGEQQADGKGKPCLKKVEAKYVSGKGHSVLVTSGDEKYAVLTSSRGLIEEDGTDLCAFRITPEGFEETSRVELGRYVSPPLLHEKLGEKTIVSGSDGEVKTYTLQDGKLSPKSSIPLEWGNSCVLSAFDLKGDLGAVITNGRTKGKVFEYLNQPNPQNVAKIDLNDFPELKSGNFENYSPIPFHEEGKTYFVTTLGWRTRRRFRGNKLAQFEIKDGEVELENTLPSSMSSKSLTRMDEETYCLVKTDNRLKLLEVGPRGLNHVDDYAVTGGKENCVSPVEVDSQRYALFSHLGSLGRLPFDKDGFGELEYTNLREIDTLVHAISVASIEGTKYAFVVDAPAHRDFLSGQDHRVRLHRLKIGEELEHESSIHLNFPTNIGPYNISYLSHTLLDGEAYAVSRDRQGEGRCSLRLIKLSQKQG